MKKSYYTKPSYELIHLLSNDVILTSEKLPTGDQDPLGLLGSSSNAAKSAANTNDSDQLKSAVGFSPNKENISDGFENETIIEDVETPINDVPQENINPDVTEQIPNDIPTDIVSELNEINEPVVEDVQ